MLLSLVSYLMLKIDFIFSYLGTYYKSGKLYDNKVNISDLSHMITL